MIIVPPIQYRRRRKRSRNAAPTPAGPVLTAATYDNVGLTITLTFDRAIDVAGLNGNVIIVNDGSINLQRYRAVGTVTVLGPTQVRVGLSVNGSVTPDVTTLNASAGNGILAQSDAVEWAGATVDLPF